MKDFSKKTVLGKWIITDEFLEELENENSEDLASEQITFWKPQQFKLSIPIPWEVPIKDWIVPFGSVEVKLFNVGVISILLRFKVGDNINNVKKTPHEILGLIKNPDIVKSGKLCLFNWDSVPGDDSKKLIKLLKDEFEIDCGENVEIHKSVDNMIITISKNGEDSAEITRNMEEKKLILKIRDGRTYDLGTSIYGKLNKIASTIAKTIFERFIKEFEEKYSKARLFSFNWDSVPGNDSEVLIKFLREDIGIAWMENVKILKSNDSKTIRIFEDDKSEGDNSTEITIEEGGEKLTITTSNGKTYELKVEKDERGKLNIYSEMRISCLGKRLGSPLSPSPLDSNKFCTNWDDVTFYVGTLIPNPPVRPQTRLELLNAYIALARTTPALLTGRTGFNNLAKANEYLDNTNISTGDQYIIIEERSWLVVTSRLIVDLRNFRARIFENIIFCLEATFATAKAMNRFIDNLDIVENALSKKLRDSIFNFTLSKSITHLTDCTQDFAYYYDRTRRVSLFGDEICNLDVRVSSETLKKAIAKAQSFKLKRPSEVAKDKMLDLNQSIQAGFSFISNFTMTNTLDALRTMTGDTTNTLRSIDRLTVVVVVMNVFVLLLFLHVTLKGL